MHYGRRLAWLLSLSACASAGEPSEPLSARPTGLLEPLVEYGELRRRVEWSALAVCEPRALGVVIDECWQGWRVTASAPTDGRVDYAYFGGDGWLAGLSVYQRYEGRTRVYGDVLYGCTLSPARLFFCIEDHRTPPR